MDEDCRVIGVCTYKIDTAVPDIQAIVEETFFLKNNKNSASV